ncbi:MAG: cysteine--tRNA ligase [Polyangiales bacterium]
MTLELHDTLTGTKKPLVTTEPGHARMYVCGPTVYDYAHLGHARCYVVWDVLYRHLLASGYRVTYVRNVTDVDDKILKRASERGETPTELASRFTAEYTADMDRLKNLRPTVEPRVSEHIAQIVALVERLIARGHAYATNDGDVYFDVASDPGYGKLSHRDLAQLSAGASGRTDAELLERKKNAADFALWKSASRDQWGWESPWGWGRPGWHIECSAMSMHHLGETFDLHGGGLDLVFPHHENEIAQSECATGKPFANVWVHNGFVEVDKEKMSKSLGNFFTARDLFERCEPEAVRYFVMTVHYRSPLALDWELDDAGNVRRFPQFEDAERRVEYLYGTKRRLASLPAERVVDVDTKAPTEIAGFPAALAAALDDDLNMPIALAAIAGFLAAVNELCDGALRKKGKAARSHVEDARRGFEAIEARLGLGAEDPGAVLERIRDRRALARGVSKAMVEERIVARAEARGRKDFAAADAVRDELAALGVELLDGADGTSWTIP